MTVAPLHSAIDKWPDDHDELDVLSPEQISEQLEVVAKTYQSLASLSADHHGEQSPRGHKIELTINDRQHFLFIETRPHDTPQDVAKCLLDAATNKIEPRTTLINPGPTGIYELITYLEELDSQDNPSPRND